MKLPPPVNPALIEHAEERGKSIQNRIADKLTAAADANVAAASYHFAADERDAGGGTRTPDTRIMIPLL
jgi:hypothetical protein